MAGVTPPLQQQTPATASVMTPPEEEFLKRNTDCVYFLASPLTCKKGSECEYRHSDIARMNPRDCWYWLNGNCLNPKCAFRHPPLDGLLGAEVPIHVAPPMPQLQTPAVPATNTPYVTSKQGVPCIFFQKGYCLKGDKCPFLHPPASGSIKVAQSKAPAPVSEPPVAKNTFWGLENCTQEQKVLQKNIPKSVELPPQRKPAARVEVAPTRNGAVEKNVPPPSILGDELPRYRPRSVPPTNEISSNRSNRAYQAHVTDNDSSLNGKDADEFSREPSPGFDVLVDDELRDSDYYPSEEQFGRARGHEGRNMNPMNDYDLGHSSADYNLMADVEQDMYRDPRDYERRQGGHYGWEEQRLSSERILGGSSRIQRKRDPRDESPEELVDLRQRISKQRNGGNGLRSVVSRTRDGHTEDRDYRRGPRRDRESHLAPPSHEGSLSSRLRGRIKMPGRSISPVHLSDTRTVRDRDVGRHRARLSPVRLNTISSQGRLKDRIKGRVQEEEGRDFRGPIRRDGIISNIGFSGPKRLSELKGGKVNEGHESQMNGLQLLGKRKYPKAESLQQSEDELSFEGPKPLSEILKRKRGAEPQVFRSGGYNNEGNKESLIKSTVYDSNKEESHYASVETKKQVLTEKTKETDKEEAEEGLIGDDAMEDQEVENFDHGEGDFDYEQQVEGEDYNLEEGENIEAEEEEVEEYLDEDDGDDFAKQMGIELS